MTDEQRESLRPVAWKEEVGGGRVKLTGRIPIERRTRGQYLVVRQGAEEYSLWARMPANMHKSGSWEERVYLGRDPALTMEERVSVTSRYVPPGR